MSLMIALHDAATNCRRDNALARLTLKSGVEFVGVLEKDSLTEEQAHMHIGEGWSTILVAELAAVSSQRKPRA